MLELTALDLLAAVAARTVQFSLFFVALVIYTFLKLFIARVAGVQTDAAPETGAADSKSEKLALAADVEEPPQNTAGVPASLIVWAVAILPINVAAWELTNVAWAATRERKLGLWEDSVLSALASSPITAALYVFLCALFLSLKDTRADMRAAEVARVLLRIGVLDGALLAPAVAVYTAWLFPERVLGERGALVGIAAYAAQALVWAYFFCASRHESQANLSAARVIV